MMSKTNEAGNNKVNLSADNAAGADAGAQKTFTQEEVNNIVQERLARFREKNEPSPLELKERELAARENAISCREYITEKGYPKELLEMFDTSDLEDFKAKTGKLYEHFEIIPKSEITNKIVGTGVRHGTNTKGNTIAEAFRRK